MTASHACVQRIHPVNTTCLSVTQSLSRSAGVQVTLVLLNDRPEAPEKFAGNSDLPKTSGKRLPGSEKMKVLGFEERSRMVCGSLRLFGGIRSLSRYVITVSHCCSDLAVSGHKLDMASGGRAREKQNLWGTPAWRAGDMALQVRRLPQL
jgi:hypothetical protein